MNTVLTSSMRATLAQSLLLNGASVSGLQGLTPGAIPFGNVSGTWTDTSSNGGGATGNAGQLLMSYGNIANGGPEWVQFQVHQSVQVVSTSNIAGTYTVGGNTTNDYPISADTFTVTTPGAVTVDGYTLQQNDRILFAGQTTQTQNGIWLCTTVGSGSIQAVFCRDNDADTPSKLSASLVQVALGNTYASTAWQLGINSLGTLGTTPIPVYQLINSAGGTINGTLTTSGLVTIGTPNFQSGIYTGSLANIGSLQVNGASNLFGSVNLNGQTVYGVGSLTTSGLTVTSGAVTSVLVVNSGLTVNGIVPAAPGASIYAPNGGLSVASGIYVGGSLGNTTVNVPNGGATIGGNLTVNNNATIKGNLTVSGVINNINPLAYGNPNVGESFSRYIATTATNVASATMRLAGVYLTAGQVVNNITFATGSAVTASGLTSAWGGIFTASGTTTTMYLLASTSGQSNPNYGPTTVNTVPLSSPYTVPSNGIYLVGFVFFGTQPPSFAGTGNAGNGILGVQFPVIMGQTSAASYTTPPANGTSFSIGGSSYAPWFALT